MDLNYYNEQHINSLHLVLLGSFNALICDSEQTVGKGAKHVQRERSRFFPHFRGLPVCRKTYQFAHAIGDKVFKNIKKHFNKVGLQERMHGLAHVKSPQKRMPFESILRIKSYIQNYSEQVSLVLPGRVNSFSNPDLLLLPSNDTKQKVYNSYKLACEECGVVATSLSYFKNVWRDCFPNVVIQKPRTDLCSTCQKNFRSLGALRTMDESKKIGLLESSSKHLHEVSAERTVYQKHSFNVQRNGGIKS